MKTNCFCCEKKIKMEHGCPLNGTTWETNGNYNSCLFDPMGDEFLEIIVCDDCLRKKAKITHYFTLERTEKRINVTDFSVQLKKYDKAKEKLKSIIDKKDKLKHILLEETKNNRRKKN